MGKAKRAEKRARKAAKGTAAEQTFRAAEARGRRRARWRRGVAVAIFVLTLAVAGVAYAGFGQGQVAGVSLLVGAIVFFLYGLSVLGAGVEPKDRQRAGSIDFGRRR
jgi:uncharacterized ion transporter superfamily protein YfcC